MLFGGKFIKSHACEHGDKENDDKSVPENDTTDGGSRTESREPPSDPKQDGTADKLPVYRAFLLPREMPFFSEERLGVLPQKEMSDDGNNHRSDHHKNKGRVPAPEDIEESLDAGRGEHIRKRESEPEERSGSGAYGKRCKTFHRGVW